MPVPDRRGGLVGRSAELRARSARTRELSALLIVESAELMVTAAEIYEALALTQRRGDAGDQHDAGALLP